MEKIYEAYKTDIFRFIFSFTKDVSSAEDLMQDTFLRLYERKDTLRDAKKVKSWLFSTAKNLTLNYLAQTRLASAEEVGDTAAAPDTSYGYLEWTGRLTEEERLLVSLRIIGRLHWKEIGAILETEGATLRKRYERILKKLKEQWEEAL